MPPDSRADGPGGPKARRTRGPASPGQRTAQPFGGTLNASPLRCASGASVSRGRSAGTPQAAVHAGHRSSQAFRDPCGPPYTRGIGPRGGSTTHAGHRTRGASALAGVPQASRRPPPTRGLGLPRAFGRHSAGRRTRGASALAGVPPPAAHAGHRPPRGFRRSPAARRHTRGLSPRRRFARLPPPAARPHLPAARFSRKPPCGIGSRMVYCT